MTRLLFTGAQAPVAVIGVQTVSLDKLATGRRGLLVVGTQLVSRDRPCDGV